MKNFVEQISIKFGSLYLIKINLVQTVRCRYAHQNIGKHICGNSYIGRYSKGQISVDRYMVVVVLSDPFRGIGAWRNCAEIQPSGHAPRFGPEIKNGRSSAKDGTPERLRCGTLQEVIQNDF